MVHYDSGPLFWGSPMNESHAVAVLKERRAELEGKIRRDEQQLRTSRRLLEHLDRTLQFLDPSLEITDVHARRSHAASWAQRGEMSRMLLGLLRKADHPLSAQELSVLLVAERGLSSRDKRLMTAMRSRVGTALRGLRDKGRVSGNQSDKRLVWTLPTP
jgi:hypothetical protein